MSSAVTTDAMTTDEGKRARVRRLLIHPLAADGFRKRVKTSDEDHRNFLDRVADSLAYMTDDGLRALRRSLATKGDGSSRDFWPSYACIIGLAEAFEPRPLEHAPELLRWFASRAGPAALEAGRHVAEYEFWKKHKRPPVMPGDKARVAEVAAKWNDKAERIRDVIRRRGRANFDDDLQWLDWYEKTWTDVEALIDGGGA
ncbi:hypothetical protein FIU89_11200 [Roseovarius sp. THAF27]|uniref:hypothetical protein n=1 Tax=Roseovarius sp. THAF27 TaxID=2587850 RepID=UPI00126819B7|nr:hypothetical protein [Roseovarius sp. THAF27]QFT81176.1 hypothetical protein FIU89_11200 [Roseovarius sp. THAF27]